MHCGSVIDKWWGIKRAGGREKERRGVSIRERHYFVDMRRRWRKKRSRGPIPMTMKVERLACGRACSPLVSVRKSCASAVWLSFRFIWSQLRWLYMDLETTNNFIIHVSIINFLLTVEILKCFYFSLLFKCSRQRNLCYGVR